MQSNKYRSSKLVLFSTILSFICPIAAYLLKISAIGFLISLCLFLFHLILLLANQKWDIETKLMDRWILKSDHLPVRFVVVNSILSTGLSFLSWIFLFDSTSLVRNAIIQASPILGWILAISIYLLLRLNKALNAGGEKQDGLLMGSVLFSIAGHVFLFWLSAQIFAYTIDDAYITFRYSKNFAAGFGPTYNPGLPPVEGYTTFLWMLLMTVPHFVGINVATFSKLFGLLLTCGTLALISVITFRLTDQFPIKARLFFGSFAGFLLAMLPITAIHAIAGMETSLFIFLIGLFMFLVIVGLQDNTRLFFLSPIVGLAIGMTRPEGNIISLLLLGLSWFFTRRENRKRFSWFIFGLYFFPGAVYFLWRYMYYDLFLPLPFYMKVLHGSGLFGGANEVGTYLLYLLPGVSVLLMVAILRVGKFHMFILTPVIFLLIFYLFPVHAMGFSWRFIYPATPFIFILIASGGITIFEFLRGVIKPKILWEPVLVAGFFLIGIGNLNGLSSMIKNLNHYGAGISNYKTFGTLLSEYNNQHEFTIAIGDAGTVPYYSDWQVIDLFGLNSLEIAFRSESVPTLLFEQQNTDLILLSVGPNPNRISEEHAGSQRLYTEATNRDMALIGTFSFGRVNNIWVIGYPGSELGIYLQENMKFK